MILVWPCAEKTYRRDNVDVAITIQRDRVNKQDWEGLEAI